MRTLMIAGMAKYEIAVVRAAILGARRPRPVTTAREGITHLRGLVSHKGKFTSSMYVETASTAA